MILDFLSDNQFSANVHGLFNKKKALNTFDKAISTGKSIIHEQIFKLANPDYKRVITIGRFKEVARLSDGCSFGELALLKNEGRAATI